MFNSSSAYAGPKLTVANTGSAYDRFAQTAANVRALRTHFAAAVSA